MGIDPADDTVLSDGTWDVFPDVTDPADVELPLIPPGPQAGPDPVILLTDLIKGNAQTMSELSAQGAKLDDGHPLISTMIVQEFLESILRAIAGEAEVVAAGVRVHEQIANTLAMAKSQVSQAKLAAPGGLSPSAMMNGNRQQRRHG
jgi:hypothetical protein